ncbi:pantoate--beta-alanine ligase [Candidatus Pelagibacter bacterium]|nr:pantoate--beta-alanine ligase [Candidatus Pelagibacter bacterium]
MKIFKNKYKLQKAILNQKNLSFVPTMGGLHNGHISLIKKSKKFKGKNIVSIFVNPKQFNNKKDYSSYPRNLNKDLSILKRLKVDYVFIPNKKEIFSFKPKNNIYLDNFSKKLCGSSRKGHFKGVLNIVNRFLEIINPKKILLGTKDYQQLYLIKQHISKRRIKTLVVKCNTIREKNGMACSTRNKLLSKKQIKIGSKIYNYLNRLKKKSVLNVNKMKKDIKNFGVRKIDYLEIYNLKTHKKAILVNKNTKIFIAYYLGNIRLIDNY